jgi:transcription elongation factor GreA
MSTKVPMTAHGAEKLREELQELKSGARPSVIAAIAEARAHGDLRENAEYHAAKEQQGFIEARIRDIEHKLSHAHIVDLTDLENDGKVVFAASVCLTPLDSQETVTYQIVGEDEADLKRGKISIASPLARALIGKYEGDTVEVNTPNGVISYEITEVQYLVT